MNPISKACFLAIQKPSWFLNTDTIKKMTENWFLQHIVTVFFTSKYQFWLLLHDGSSDFWQFTYSVTSIFLLQVNLFQKHLFLHQLTHNMTIGCSLSYEFSTWKLQAQNILCTQIIFCFNIQTIYVLNMFWACGVHIMNW